MRDLGETEDLLGATSFFCLAFAHCKLLFKLGWCFVPGHLMNGLSRAGSFNEWLEEVFINL